jgi:CRP-like cAMP-binding protein
MYSANAIATKDSPILVVKKDLFKKFLLEHPAESISIIENLSRRLHYKAVISTKISSEDPEQRIMQLITP